ncbi:MAG TPA: PaaI family thioesterase [Candidatus Dormibacteraeota bacterium]
MSDTKRDFAAEIRELPEGWVRAMGIEVTYATEDEVRAEWTVEDRHLQAYGIVHGGVHCGAIETLCSIGAAIWGWQHERGVVGLENHTSFLRAVRAGTRLRAVATPVQRGKRTQVWRSEIRDDEDRVVASGQVRLLCLEQGAALGGQGLQPTPFS